MKTTIAVFLLFLHCTIALAQGKSSEVEVEYQVFYGTDSPRKMYNTLYISGNTSVYREKLSTIEPWVERSTPEIIARDKRFATGFVPDDRYMMTDRSKKEVLFFDDIMGNMFLVRDKYEDLKWQITNETKTVDGLSCVKATTNFRGRKWIAWFAPEVPLAFGPWKLNGLPGLILEAYDSTDMYIMKAVRIDYKKSDMPAKDFTKLVKTKNDKPITYQKFLEDTEEGRNNFDAGRDLAKEAEAAKAFNVTNATIGKAVTPPRTGMELKYEWEE